MNGINKKHGKNKYGNSKLIFVVVCATSKYSFDLNTTAVTQANIYSLIYNVQYIVQRRCVLYQGQGINREEGSCL